MANPHQVETGEYEEAVESHQGFCTTCREFTYDGAEPDARNYTCEECGKNTVFGAEEALMNGFIELI